MTEKILSYQEVLSQLPESKHLLLGNGFSIGCDPIFNYPDLFKFAKSNGLSQTVIKVFQHFGTNNFEGIMRILEDVKWLNSRYGFVQRKGRPTLDSELRSIKNALVAAVAKTHLAFPAEVPDGRKKLCSVFLEPYKNIFTTNYDLLLYWVSMFAHETLQTRDGFRSSSDEPNAEYLVFREHVRGSRGILFIHGALHLYVVDGEVRKHSWVRSNKRLIELVKDGLEKGQYPLFVAEGKADKKLEQIQRSGYLSYCLGKLERIEQALVVYGHSLGETDRHITNVIADNRNLEHLFIGVHTTISTRLKTSIAYIENRRKKLKAKDKRAKDIHITVYDSKTAPVWNSVAT